MNVGDVLKRTGLVAGVAAGVVGAAYASERAVVARIRHRDDPDADAPLVPTFDEAQVVDGARRRPRCTPSVAARAADRVRPRRDVDLARLGQAVRVDPRSRVPRRGVRLPRPRRVDSGESGHSVDNLADDLRSVLEALDLHDAILVGHSMGGMAVQAFAVRHPDVSATGSAAWCSMSTAARNLVSDSRRVRGAVERVTGLTPDFAAFDASAQPRVPARPRRVRQRPARQSRRGDPPDAGVGLARDAARRRPRHCSRSTSPTTSRRSRRPTLVLVGTADALTPPRDSRQIAELLPNARAGRVPGRGPHADVRAHRARSTTCIVEFAARPMPRRRRAARGGLT